MNLVTLAWRNVLRQKRRTLTSMSALVVGFTALVVFQGYLAQTMVGYRDKTVGSGLGHLQVASPGYFDAEFSPYRYALADQGALTQAWESDPRVAAVIPSTGFTAVAGAGGPSVTLLVKAYPSAAMAFGGDRAEDRREGQFQLGPLVAGSWAPGPGADQGEDGTGRIVLGETAARILNVGVGSVVTLMVLLPGGLNGRDFTVAGVYRSPGQDKIFAFTDFESAQSFTGMASAPVLHILARHAEDAPALATAVEGYEVRTYLQLAPFYGQVQTMFGGFLAVIRSILLLVTLFLLANTMNRIVLERMREWGTLRALGTKGRDILALVVLEGAFQGFLGAVLGIVGGLVVSLVVNLFGGIPYVNGDEVYAIRVAPDAATVWWTLVPVVATAALAALVPAWRAVRLQPAQALRFV